MTFAAQLKELQILGYYAQHLFEVVTMQSGSPEMWDSADTKFLALSDLVRSADRLSHLDFIHFREGGTKFVPAQHYYNTQIMLRAHKVAIATSKAMNIKQYWFYQNADDREEGFFGMQRVLEAGRNFDTIQLEERGSELMVLDDIYTRHPDWKRTARRLGGKLFDHVNPRSITGGGKNYKPVDMSNVTLPPIWMLAANDVATLLTR